MTVKRWYEKDPDLIGRVTRIVRVRKNRRVAKALTSSTVTAGDYALLAGFDMGAQWAIETIRDEYRRERENVFERVEQRRMVSPGRDVGEMSR